MAINPQNIAIIHRAEIPGEISTVLHTCSGRKRFVIHNAETLLMQTMSFIHAVGWRFVEQMGQGIRHSLSV